jgi:hypothetical protein
MNIDRKIEQAIGKINYVVRNFKTWVRQGYRQHAFTTFFTVIILLSLSVFIVIAEQFNLILFSLGPRLLGLSPLDTWLIISILIFAVPVYIIIYLLIEFKILEVQ